MRGQRSGASILLKPQSDERAHNVRILCVVLPGVFNPEKPNHHQNEARHQGEGHQYSEADRIRIGIRSHSQLGCDYCQQKRTSANQKQNKPNEKYPVLKYFFYES